MLDQLAWYFLYIAAISGGFGVNRWIKALDFYFHKDEMNLKYAFLEGILDFFHHLPLWAFITFFGYLLLAYFPIGKEAWVCFFIIYFGIGGILADLPEAIKRYKNIINIMKTYQNPQNLQQIIKNTIDKLIKFKGSSDEEIIQMIREAQEEAQKMIKNQNNK